MKTPYISKKCLGANLAYSIKKNYPNLGRLILFALLFAFSTLSFGQTPLAVENTDAKEQILIEKANLLNLLKNTPNVFSSASNNLSTTISLPLPGGQSMLFTALEWSNMHPELSDKFPEIESYVIQSTTNPMVKGRINLSEYGVYAVISTEQGIVVIEPVEKFSGQPDYQVYYDEVPNDDAFSCGTVEQFLEDSESGEKSSFVNSCFTNGTMLRTARLAFATTGEFFQLNGNSLAGAMAALDNRVMALNVIYENELSIHFELIPNNDLLINSDPATDPFTNPDATPVSGTTLTETQNFIDSVINDADYDIGHGLHEVTGNSSAGLAGVGVVCGAGNKARGFSQLFNGNAGIILMAHEFGHMFSCRHTNYGCGTAGNCARYEPGRGSTIMSTGAGCTADDFYAARSAYFSVASLDQILDFVTTGNRIITASCTPIPSTNGMCLAQTPTGNTVPTSDANPNGVNIGHTIPANTPFILVGEGIDPDAANTLTYAWEQFDQEIPTSEIPATTGDNLTAPLFRSFPPSTNPDRVFPQLSSLLNGNVTTGTGETLPEVNRTMNFRLIVRDNNLGAGAIACDAISVDVADTGAAFEVTSQNVATSLVADGVNTFTITWNVAGTTAAPIGCANVDILFSTDGGQTFPTTLASNIPNDGTETLVVPNLATSQGVIRVICSDNIFFDINNAFITITSSCAANGATFSPMMDVTAAQGNAALDLSLMPDYGNVINNIAGTIETTDTPSNLAFSDGTPAMCGGPSNANVFDSYEIYVDVTGSYTIAHGGPFGTILNIYENSFDDNSVCTNWLNSSGTRPTGVGNISPNADLTETLTAGVKYVITVSNFGNGSIPTLPAAYNVTFTTPAGAMVFDDIPSPGANFNYTYIAVNAAGNIVDIDANSNFTDLPGGTFTVYGISVENTENINTYLNGPFSDLEMDILNSAICANLSSNTIMLTITSTCIADAGDLTTTTATSNFSICSGDDLLDDAMASAVFVADYTAADETDPGAGYDYAFVLADASGNIIQTNTTGDFDFTTVTTAGTYDIYGVSYDNANSPTSVTAYLAALSPMTIAQIMADEAGATLCLDLENLNSGGTVVQVVVNTIPMYTVMGNDPTTCGGVDGSISISGLTAATMYSVSYTDDGTPVATATFTSDGGGVITISGLDAGSYTNIVVSLNGCAGAAMMATLVDPINFTDAGLTVGACNDQTTTADPSDDTFTFTLNPTGTDATGNPISGTYSVSGDATGTGTYGAATTFDNGGTEFLITGGTLTIIVTDDSNGSCQIMNVMVTPPASCSAGAACMPMNIPTDCSIPIVDFTGYDGSGIDAMPAAGQLCANSWDITGFNTVADLSRGTTSGGVGTGGLYAVDRGGDIGLWIQSGGSDFTPGTATLTVCNNSGGNMVDIDVAYDILFLNDEERGSSFNFSFSTDNVIFTPIAALDFTTPIVSDALPIQVAPRMTTLSGVNLADGSCLFLRWTGNDAGGGGSRDEFGLDNITVCPTPIAAVCNLNSAGETLETCNDNNTPTDPSDDYITFSLNPTGSMLGANYTVTSDNGGGVTLANGDPATGVAYNTDTAFRLVNGTADGATTYTLTITDSDDVMCTVMTTVSQSSCSNGLVACSDLFISEYIEEGGNKCIEIYNPTTAAIDLAAGNYVVNRYSNGGTTPAPITLTGTIASGDVFVLCNGSSDPILLAQADQLSGTLSHNGNDALELVANGITLDVFGQIGDNPGGSGWTGACGATADMNFRRMMSIQTGDNDGTDAFDPCLEYNAFPDDDFTGFGGHISTCIPCNISITTAMPTATSCDGASDGMIVITATTDNGELEYSADNGVTFQSSNTFTGLAANTYNIVVRVLGEPTCNDNTTATVAAGQAVMIGNTVITDETCAAANDGTITFNSTGPGTLEYSIDGGTTFDTNPAFTGLDAGTYNLVVQVQGIAACMETDVVVIGTGMEVMISNVATTDESCADEDDGTITITATGPGTLEYSIDNGATFQVSNVFNMQDAGTYNIVVQSQTNNACTASSTGIIGTDPDVMITDVMTTNETCPATDDGTITITATGPGTLEYSIDNGATFQPTNTFTGLDAGTYNIVVRRVGTINCTAITTAIVGSDSDVMITNVAVVDETCMAANDGSITITATGAGTLEYSIDGGTTFVTTNTFTGQDAGTYNIVVQVQGSGVCNDTDVATIGAGMEVMNTSNTVVDESCTAANDGSVTINATGPGTLEYSLDGSPFQTSNVFMGLDAGTFNIVIQSMGTPACQFMGTVTVGTSADVMITDVMTTPTSCDGATDGSIVITATGGGTLEYSIDNGATFQPSNTFNGLAPNTYNIVVQSAGTPVCMDTDMATIATGTAVDITNVVTTPTSCDGATDGTITINATGPAGATLEYSIDNGMTFSTMNVFNMQAAATYNVVVQVQGTTVCNDTDMAIVAAGTAVDITSIDTTPTSCDGATDGTITINATGPAGATLEYSIDNGVTFITTNVFNMQAAGMYNIVVQVQGTAACNDTDVATIALGTAVEITSVDTTPTSCDGETDGTITINATGPGTLEYSIDNGVTFVTTNVFNMQAAGMYDIVVQVQGTAACNDTDMATVATGVAVNITSIDVVDETCAAANDGTITVNATGPGTLEYSMDNGVTFVTTNVFTAQDAATFDVVVRVQGSAVCNDTLTTTVGTNAEVMITDVTTVDETCAGANDGTITITATGTGTLEYSIGGAFQTSNMFTGLAPNTYTITVQSQTNNACTATTMATVGTAPDITPPTAICQDITIDLDLNGDATIMPADVDNGSNDNCGVITLTSVTPNTFTCLNVGPNTVTLVVTDGSNNTDDCTATVNVNASGACVPPMITNIGGPVGFDPCSCRGNGEFDEEVVVEAGTGQTWTIVSTDLINPATMMPYAAGTMLMETVVGAGVSTYSLVGIHLDGQGYTIIVDSPSNPGAPLEMSNTCFYPDANLITDLSQAICINTAPITLEGDGNGAAGTTIFTVNGVTTNIIDPAVLGTGSFPVTFTFDAGEAGQFKVTNGVVVGPPEGVNSLAEAEADPGCTETISTFINIVVTPTTLGCNNSIQVSLDENCESLITPDMLLEGDYLCFDNYEVTLAQGLNSNIPNPLTNGNIGQNIIGTVTDLVSGNSCWTTITVEDKLAPVLDCQDITIACTADADLVAAPIANDNCDPNPTVTMVDEVINIDNNCDPSPTTGDAFTVTIVRTFIAVDNQGNTSATCQQVITVIRPDLIDIPDDLVWSCDQYDAYSYIINASRIMPSIASQFGGIIQPFDNTGAWDLTDIALTDSRLTNNVPGTTMPTGSGVPSGIFPLANGNANPLGGALDAEYCKYAYSEADQILSTCGFAASTDSPVFKIVRTWTILDWCTGNVVTDPVLFDANDDDNVQIIKVIDDFAPIVSGADVTISANIPAQHPQECTGQGPIALATATDNCTGSENIQGFVYADIALNSAVAQITPSGNGFGLLNPALPVGCYFVVWTAEDACGNVGQSVTYDLCVEDNIVPVVVCDEVTQISLSSDGLAVVFAETFDDGSYDNCCLDRFEVRRMTDNCGILGNTTFDNDGDSNDANNDPDDGEFVTFCCEDVNTTQMVVLRVFDCSDNFNECMIEVLIEDKLAPTLVCPPNATLTCDEFADDLAAALLTCANATDENACQSTALTAAGFGEATAFDNCDVIITPTVTVTIDQCGAGSVVRSFTSVDDSDNVSNPCTQVINVTQVSDWVVEFPEDQDGFCDMAEPEFGEPEIFFETCELIATSFEDQFFDIVPDACFKIVRQWTVINWCVVGDEIDQEAAAIELSEAELVPIIGFANADLDGDGDRDDRTFRDSYRGILPTSDNDPDADNQDGFITYQQVIKVQDFDAPVIDPTFEVDDLCIIDGNDGTDSDFSDCVFNGILPTPTYEDCTLDVNGNLDNNGNVVDNELTITATVFDANDNVVSNSVNVSNLEIGTYTVRYVATDRCGNTTATDYTFDVNDCKFPTPYCKDGVVLELMAINDPNNTSFEAMIELWASDLDEGSFDNCPGGIKLSFSADINDIGTTYNCDNLGENLVQLWVTDAAGNQDFCETFVIIQANQNQCEDPDPLFAIGGNIATELSVDVADVEVNINGGTMNTMEMTDLDGNYNINVPAGGDYTIVPAKDINPLNGVSTFDLVKITKHILNIELLDSPYKMIAADANKTQTITTLDLVQIRKLILLIDDNFTNNTSWRFVDADFVFPDPTNPWATGFPEIININNLPVDALSESFVAVKIGDVNGNASGNQLLGADDRNFDGTLELTTNDVAMKAGENYTVTFNAANFHNFGYQFTLDFDQDVLELNEIENGLASAENFGLTLLNEGAITTSWNQANATRLNEDEALFSITFTAKVDAQLSDVLNINSRYTTAEAYAENGDLQDIQLTFNNNDVAATFELYQNTPNPFAETTKIGFILPQASQAVLTIHDASGRLLKTIDRDFGKGYNEVQISKNELGAKGVLYYQLSTGEHTATKKMILN